MNTHDKHNKLQNTKLLYL